MRFPGKTVVSVDCDVILSTGADPDEIQRLPALIAPHYGRPSVTTTDEFHSGHNAGWKIFHHEPGSSKLTIPKLHEAKPLVRTFLLDRIKATDEDLFLRPAVDERNTCEVRDIWE